ncbi:MAG: PspC domain-containing protein [Chitinophagales bacterium]
MKKTININLGGFVFQIDEDAYDRLNNYLEALKQKFTNLDEQNEIIQDIEYRFAELFGSGEEKNREVVSLQMVNKAIATMGEPEEIEEELDQNDKTFSSSQQTTYQSTSKKLFRDPDDKIFAGVMSGLSRYFGVKDAIWFRIAMVLLVFAGFGFPVIAYFILWFLVPEAQNASEKLQMNGDAINLDNIEEQVKKNLNSEEIRRTSVKIANKFSELVPIILKVIAVFLIILFGIKLIGISLGIIGGGLFTAAFNPDFIGLVFNSKALYYLSIFSFYLLLAIPIALALFLAVKLLTNSKIKWFGVLVTSFILFIFSLVGLGFAGFDVASNFRQNAEQVNYVQLQNPTVDELEFVFPYEKLEEDINMSVNFNNNGTHFNINDEDSKINGFEIVSGQKQIKINQVELDIVLLQNDSIFKLSKIIGSKGRTIEEAENHLSKINNDFEIVNENMIAIPRMMLLEDESQWRVQRLKYKLYMPEGKRVHFGDNAKKLIDNVNFNGDYSRKNLANNTWEMTVSGLKCITCQEDKDI